MRAALALARRGLGDVWPNPAVGCVIVKDGRVVGRGWTQSGGRPHAETEALRRAGDAALGACAYVTLEPCNHFGQTPPCAQALLDAGVARVVTALEDPDPRTSGTGHERLRLGGVDVVTDVLRSDAMSVNIGFLSRLRNGRPWTTLKTATTLDGKIAAKGGASQWITGTAARARGHVLRATHDAIMVGIGTALADVPMLTCRAAGLEERSPVRIVVDSALRLPLESPLVETARKVPTWVLTAYEGPRCDDFVARGVKIIKGVSDSDGRVDMTDALAVLGKLGVTRLLVEGGGALAASLLRADLIDNIHWFRADAIMGADGISAISEFGITHPDQMARFARVKSLRVGCDLMETFEKRRLDC